MTEEDRVRLRHTDRWVGALVLVCVGIFLAFALERSVIREWFAGGSKLTVLMPAEGGVAGLSAGSEAEVLGVRAGSVRRIVVAPEGRIRAELLIDDQVRNFIRSDSVAPVRRRFGVAGPAYLDIARGEGAQLDWGHNAVIEAKVEQAATETAGALLEDLRRRVFPILDDLQRGTRAFADATERLQKGEGTVGRLLADPTLAQEAEEAARRANALLASLNPVFLAGFRDAKKPENERAADTGKNLAAELKILDGQLAKTPFVAGNELTIADMTLGPVVRRCVAMPFGLPAFPNGNAWLEKLNARPAFKKATAAG